jgi:hypothetical protein
MGFKCTIAFVLILLVLTHCKLGSLSLYHVGGTTFLNLKKPSRQATFQYTFSTLGNQADAIMTRLEPIFGIPEKVEKSYVWKNTSLGAVTLTDTTLSTFLFDTPNGHRDYQGWIGDESDYLPPQMEAGQEPTLLSMIDILQNHPVRQVSLEVGVDVPEDPMFLRNLLINVFRPENRKHILQDNNFKAGSTFSRGFLDKLLNQKDGKFTYNPSMLELFEDFVIRQTLERIGTPASKAWSFPITECRQMLIGLQYTHPRYAVDIMPLLLSLFPDDPITMHISKFVQPIKTVLFLEFAGNANVAVRRAVGIVKATEMYGFFVSDNLVGQISNIQVSLISKIRSKLLDNERVIVKYITWDPEKCARVSSKRARELTKLYEKDGIILGFISNNLYGLSPLIIPGESVVWHQRTEHRFNLLGMHNPALINYNIAHLLENKYYESLYYNAFCPGMFPRTMNAVDLVPSTTNVTLSQLLTGINKEFEKGWVIKGIWDYNTQSDVLHHNHNYKQILNEMKEAQFLPWVAKVEKLMKGCEPIEDVNIVVRKTNHFMAWRLWGYLNNIQDVIVQEFLPIHREFRIEGFGGKMKREWMTNDDHSDMDDKEDHEYYQTRVNREFTKCIHSMPERLRGTPLTADIALLKDLKTVTILETNPGGNGYLYHHDSDLLKQHNTFLKKYHELYVNEPKVQTGLNGVEQMKFVDRLFESWNFTTNKYDNRYKYLSDRIMDLEHILLTTVNEERLNSGSFAVPVEFISTGERYATIRDVMEHLDKEKGIKSYPLNEIGRFLARISLTKESFSYNKELENILLEFRKSESSLIEAVSRRMHNLVQNHDLKSLDDGVFVSVVKDVLEQIPHIHRLAVLNAGGIKETLFWLDSVFVEIARRNHIEWSAVAFPAFNETQRVVLNAKSSGFVIKSPMVLKEFSQSLLSFRALNRLGYEIPQFDITSVVKRWRPDLQNLFGIFEMNDLSQSVHPLFISLVESVTTIVNVFSDQSLMFLDRSAYLEEYRFLVRALHHGAQMKDGNLLGAAIDALMVLSVDEDEEMNGRISTAREILIKLVSEDSVWKIAGKKSLYATTNAILGLVEHSYLTRLNTTLGYAEMTPLASYRERLGRIGFFKLDKHPVSIEPKKEDKHDEL